ncbi:MAG: Right handed beta helix region [Chlamydiales bacterium]|jgi:parallel beta-helix repeat protein|nr:Right handed beta helix region [Chlamydiales bacterium]
MDYLERYSADAFAAVQSCLVTGVKVINQDKEVVSYQWGSITWYLKDKERSFSSCSIEKTFSDLSAQKLPMRLVDIFIDSATNEERNLEIYRVEELKSRIQCTLNFSQSKIYCALRLLRDYGVWNESRKIVDHDECFIVSYLKTFLNPLDEANYTLQCNLLSHIFQQIVASSPFFKFPSELDNPDSIQRMINCAPDDKQTTIELRAGEYILNAGLIIDKPVRLIGSSKGKTKIRLKNDHSLHQAVILIGRLPPSDKDLCWTLNDYELWEKTSLKDVTIQNIDIEGNMSHTKVTEDGRYPYNDEPSLKRIKNFKQYAGYTDAQQATEWDYRFDDIDNIDNNIRFCRGVKANGIAIWNSENVTIEGCRIFQARSGGIVPYAGSKNISILDCSIENNFIDGIAPDSIHSLTIRRCTIKNNRDAGFSWSFAAGVQKFPDLIKIITITDCTFENNGTGLWGNNIHNMVLSQCVFRNNKLAQIRIDPNEDSLGSHKNCVLDCTFEADPEYQTIPVIDWRKVVKPYFPELENFVQDCETGSLPLNADRGRNDGYIVLKTKSILSAV